MERVGNDENHQPKWKCVCDCGGTVVTIQKRLKCGGVRSCGCLKKEAVIRQGHLNATHRETGLTPEYRAWRSMINRCYNSKSKNFGNYGGRGIQVCKRWRESYESFLEDVGRRPSSEHSLDRFPDNDGNYEPSNVRWATKEEQGRNRRTNRLITINGETKCLREWSQFSGVGENTIKERIARGWQDERLIQPVAGTSL